METKRNPLNATTLSISELDATFFRSWKNSERDIVTDIQHELNYGPSIENIIESLTKIL